MQVSHSGAPNLNILEILNHFWPTSESCRQATTKDMDSYISLKSVRAEESPTFTYPQGRL